jgi:hypothetical protein
MTRAVTRLVEGLSLLLPAEGRGGVIMSEHALPPHREQTDMPKGHPNKGYTLTPQREEVLHILATEGPIDDRDGLLVGRLAERLGYRFTQTLSMVIKGLEAAGLIKRDVAGRRTYRLEIVPGAVAKEDLARLGFLMGQVA